MTCSFPQTHGAGRLQRLVCWGRSDLDGPPRLHVAVRHGAGTDHKVPHPSILWVPFTALQALLTPSETSQLYFLTISGSGPAAITRPALHSSCALDTRSFPFVTICGNSCLIHPVGQVYINKRRNAAPVASLTQEAAHQVGAHQGMTGTANEQHQEEDVAPEFGMILSSNLWRVHRCQTASLVRSANNRLWHYSTAKRPRIHRPSGEYPYWPHGQFPLGSTVGQ